MLSALTLCMALAAQNYVIDGDDTVVTATVTPTAVANVKAGCQVTFVNLTATPLCTGYSSSMTCEDTGSASINVCSDSSKCVATFLSREAASGILYYRIKGSLPGDGGPGPTLANVVIEVGKCQR